MEDPLQNHLRVEVAEGHLDRGPCHSAANIGPFARPLRGITSFDK